MVQRNWLKVDGVVETLNADFELRFVNVPGQSAQPELYRKGKRVVKPWEIVLEANHEREQGNANTD